MDDLLWNFTTWSPTWTEADDTSTTEGKASAGNDSTADGSVEVVLQRYLGARYRSMAESVILTIVYSCIFLTGVVGNVSTCIVITKNHYMHTATNYYLFSLAISDVLTLILGKSSDRRMTRSHPTSN